MLYIRKIKPFEVTKSTKDVLIIKRPRKLKELYLKLAIYTVVGLATLYYTFTYHQSILLVNLFLLMACAVPIIYLFISAAGLITEITSFLKTDENVSYETSRHYKN